MVIPLHDEGLSINYQGYTCTPLFSYSRSLGLEPDFGYVHILREDFGDFTITESLRGAEAPRFTTRVDEPGQGFMSSGDLVVTEKIEDKTYSTTFRHVLVTTDAVKSVIPVDDASDLVRVSITDIRYLWSRRGVVFDWVNVLPQAATLPARRTITTLADLPADVWIEGSLTNGAEPYTLRQVLEEIIIPRLPGQPPLRRLPLDLETAVPINHVWDGVPTKRALADLLEEFNLVLALNPDSSISLWRPEEGPAQLQNGDPIPPNVVSHNLPLIAYHYKPAVVLVLGPARILGTRIDNLEAVGETFGTVVPLEDALRGIGLTMAQAMRFALATPQERSTLFDVTPEAVKEFDRWAFKWYRLPGGELAHLDHLPMVDRPALDTKGLLLPPRVFSESVTVADVAVLLDRGTTGPTADLLRQRLRAANGSELLALVNLPFQEASGGYRLDRDRGIVMFDRVMGTVFGDAVLSHEVPLNEPARVAVEFGYRSKPRAIDQLTISHRYFSVWVRDGADGARQEPVLPVDAFPLVVHRPDLQEVRDVSGNHNRALLDEVARGVAEEVFKRPTSTLGGEVQLHRPMPAVNTGMVQSITWSTEAELPRVRLFIGTKEPFAPADEPITTRARNPAEPAVRDIAVMPRGWKL